MHLIKFLNYVSITFNYIHKIKKCSERTIKKFFGYSFGEFKLKYHVDTAVLYERTIFTPNTHVTLKSKTTPM